jgi:hypothetical protein
MLEGDQVGRLIPLDDLKGPNLDLLDHPVDHGGRVRFLRSLSGTRSDPTAYVALVGPQYLELRLLSVLPIDKCGLLTEYLGVSQYHGGRILDTLGSLSISYILSQSGTGYPCGQTLNLWLRSRDIVVDGA